MKPWWERVEESRPPDFIIGGKDTPYMLRWWIIPRNRFLNVYLHKFLRSDDDRALHDHPWINASILLSGEYTEHMILAGGVHHAKRYVAGNVRFRSARTAHRIEIDKPCWSLFVTGPVIREWGFHCPQGWRHWKVFVSERDSGSIGRGCE
jgi:hypothetical protein